jgi:curved DNA-binding protein CbpA
MSSKMSMSDYRALFGYNENDKFTIEELKIQFKKLKKKYHPDFSKKDTQETFCLVQDGYEALKSTLKRQDLLTTQDIILESKRNTHTRPEIKKKQNVSENFKSMTHMFQQSNITPKNETQERKKPPSNRKKMSREEISKVFAINRRLKEKKNAKMAKEGIVQQTQLVNVDPFASNDFNMHAVSFNDDTGEYGNQNVFNQFEYSNFTPEQDDERKQEWVEEDLEGTDSDFESQHSLDSQEIKDYHLKYT